MKNWSVTLGMIVALYLVGQWLHGQNTKAEIALCSLRADVQARAKDDQRDIDKSLAYLQDVRTGQRSPIRGITSADIVRGIRDKRETLASRQRTLSALSDLNCK